MKNNIFLSLAAIAFSFAVHGQSTADSIQAKYKLQPMPAAMTIDKVFPVIGTYQLNAPANGGTVVISLDSSNKGMVWVDGLPEGRMKAYLKKAPTTYRIVAQRTSTGKEIPEGTLVYNQDNNTLNISLGAPYNDADPTAIFANANVAGADASVTEEPAKVKVKTKNGTVKTKARVMYYTGVKTSIATGNATSSIN